jgi:sugar lactone lactonase YvrE
MAKVFSSRRAPAPVSTAVLALIVSPCATSQIAIEIQTFAGGALPVNISGTSASLRYPNSVAVDGAGNVFFADENHVVLRLDAKTGILTLVAGTGTPGYSGDGDLATSAQLSSPHGVAVDATGNVYIADTANCRIRKVSVSNGAITTVAGNGTCGFGGGSGPATSVQLQSPAGIALDSLGNLYIADSGNNVVRQVSLPNGTIATVAGSGNYGYSGDGGSATLAQLKTPFGVAVDSLGKNLYIADTGNNRVRQVSGGVITTVAGSGTLGYSGDGGSATSAQLSLPWGVAVDSSGNLYIADVDNNRIRMVSSGVIATVAGSTAGYSGDNGPPASSQLYLPDGVALDSSGSLYIADSYNNRVRKVTNPATNTGVITTLAGNGTSGYSGDGGLATSRGTVYRRQCNHPHGLARNVDNQRGDRHGGGQRDDRIRRRRRPANQRPDIRAEWRCGGPLG